MIKWIKYILKQEKRLAGKIFKEFKNNKKEFIELLINRDQKKWLIEDIDWFLNKIKVGVVDIITWFIPAVIQKWASKNIIKYEKLIPGFAINFELRNDPASRYIQTLKDLHLSQRKWSISLTTRQEIIKLIEKWINDWSSWTEIAKNIESLDPFVFSFERAKLIATNETTKAFELWNYLPMKECKDRGYTVLKFWSTVNDDRVRESHTMNQNDWRIEIDILHSWTWSLFPPGWLRCRCTELYKAL